MSLVASYVSGITLLGTSTEIYIYGIQYAYISAAPIVMGIFMHYIIIPVFYDLKVVSMFEVRKGDKLISFHCISHGFFYLP
jgi:solute carrier family 5 (sodium-coupled monocarboxylate transporter), member 8/12